MDASSCGRRAEFQEELEKVEAGLDRLARQLMPDACSAEDLRQEALLKAYRFYGSFRAGSNFRAWMHRILYTTFISKARGGPFISASLCKEPEVPAGPSAIDQTPPDHMDGLHESVDDVVKDALTAIPIGARMVVMLCAWRGLKYREVAEVLGCPIGTVMSRYHRARKDLKSALSAYAISTGFKVA